MKNYDQLFSRLSYGIISIAILLRVIIFLQNRSLFIDEASLSSQLIGKSFGGLFGNFVDQFAPPFFCVFVKAATEIFGSTEYSLRLIPLIFGILGIFLFYQICKVFLEPKHILFPLLLFCFSIYFVQYSTEVKQYASDAAIALGLLFMSLKVNPKSIQNKHFLWWALIGVISIWFSMPVVFILFSVGIYYGFSFIKEKDWKPFYKLSFVILTWLISFGIYFFSIIKNDIGIEKLENYHSPFFIPILPTSFEDFVKFGNIFLSFFRTAIGSTAIAIGWGILASLTGIFVLFKKDRLLGLLLLLPILMTILASGLQYYSLIPRLTLFFIPILILFIGKGTQTILDHSPKLLQWPTIALLLIIVFNQKSYPYFFQRFEIEELRPVLNYVNQHSSPQSKKYVHYQAENAYIFYSQFYEHKELCELENAVIGMWDDRVGRLVLEGKEESLWLIFSHFDQVEIDKILSEINGEMQIKNRFNETGASCYLLERRKNN